MDTVHSCSDSPNPNPMSRKSLMESMDKIIFLLVQHLPEDDEKRIDGISRMEPGNYEKFKRIYEEKGTLN